MRLIQKQKRRYRQKQETGILANRLKRCAIRMLATFYSIFGNGRDCSMALYAHDQGDLWKALDAWCGLKQTDHYGGHKKARDNLMIARPLGPYRGKGVRKPQHKILLRCAIKRLPVLVFCKNVAFACSTVTINLGSSRISSILRHLEL